MSLLEIDEITVRFGGLTALKDVSMRVESGRTLGIIGPNGAGKSTLLNCVTRYYQPTSGQLRFQDHDLLEHPRSAICGLGIARTFQNLELFEEQSVRENIVFGGISHLLGSGTALNITRRRQVRQELESDAAAIMAEMELEGDAGRAVRDLPYPDRKRVEFARALMSRPALLFLDEPTSGMGPQDSKDFAALLRSVKTERDITLAIIAHDMPFVFSLCDEVIVLNLGEILTQGPPDVVRRDPEVVKVYLGDDE